MSEDDSLKEDDVEYDPDNEMLVDFDSEPWVAVTEIAATPCVVASTRANATHAACSSSRAANLNRIAPRWQLQKERNPLEISMPFLLHKKEVCVCACVDNTKRHFVRHSTANCQPLQYLMSRTHHDNVGYVASVRVIQGSPQASLPHWPDDTTRFDV